MITVGDVYQALDAFAPFSTQEKWDNSGLLVGSAQMPAERIYVTLDLSAETIAAARAQQAQLMVAHHPVIFQPLKRLSPTDVPYLLVQNGLCAIAAHTNYDLACGGVNACLAERLQLKQISMLEEYEHSGLAASLIGQLETEMKSSEFAAYVKTQLECKGLKFTVGKTKVKKVAVACGAGSSSIFAAGAAGADAFVSGDSKKTLCSIWFNSISLKGGETWL